MNGDLTDTQIRAGLRAVLTRHHVDLSKTSFSCARGVVRLLGELRRHGVGPTQSLELGEMDTLERELGAVKGVARVHFELANWRRLASGEWRPVATRRERAATSRERRAYASALEAA